MGIKDEKNLFLLNLDRWEEKRLCFWGDMGEGDIYLFAEVCDEILWLMLNDRQR